MSDTVETLLDAFGNAVIKRDHEALDVLLAPWLAVNATLDHFATFFNELLVEWELPEGSNWPSGFDGGSESLTYEELRTPSDFPPGVDIPDRVTQENYVSWAHITFNPSDSDDAIEFDAYCDAWLAIVQIAGTFMVGSLELVEPD